MLSLKSAIYDLQTYDVETLSELNNYYNYLVGQVKASKEKLLKLYLKKYIELLQIEPIKNCDINLNWINPYYSDPINAFSMKNLVTVYFEKNLQCNIALVSDGYIAQCQKTELPLGKYIVYDNSLYFYQEQDYAILDLHKSYKRVGKINLSAQPSKTIDQYGSEKMYFSFDLVKLNYQHCKQYNQWYVYTYHQNKPAILTQTPEMYSKKFVVVMPIII